MTTAAPLLDERTFVARFRDGTLGTDHFHHRDHVRMAWLYVREHGLEAAVTAFTADLRAFARAKGVPGLYHATITVAYLTLIAERLRGTPDTDWEAFAAAHADLLRWKPSVIDDYYSAERLWSDQARGQFLLPDRVPGHSSHATA
jgi:2'-5' RNA ligase